MKNIAERLWVEQHKGLPSHDSRVERVINKTAGSPLQGESCVAARRRGYYIAMAKYGHGYLVLKSQNLLRPPVGSWLDERETEELIKLGVSVTVIPPKEIS